MHPYSKLRCESCPSIFETYQCGQIVRDSKPCDTHHTCPSCGSPAQYASLTDIEKDQFLHIVKYANQFESTDPLELMEDVSLRLSSTFWFDPTHSIIEACLNVLPENEMIVRTYLEHIYTQVYEDVIEEANEYHHGFDW